VRHYTSIIRNKIDIRSTLPGNISPEEWDFEAVGEIKVQFNTSIHEENDNGDNLHVTGL
jgi:hypothetical protein